MIRDCYRSEGKDTADETLDHIIEKCRMGVATMAGQ